MPTLSTRKAEEVSHRLLLWAERARKKAMWLERIGGEVGVAAAYRKDAQQLMTNALSLAKEPPAGVLDLLRKIYPGGEVDNDPYEPFLKPGQSLTKELRARFLKLGEDSLEGELDCLKLAATDHSSADLRKYGMVLEKFAAMPWLFKFVPEASDTDSQYAKYYGGVA